MNFAALANHGPAVTLLLARGASINLTNKTGFTPALHAVEGGAIDVLRILIEAGADVSLGTPTGLTPLTMAQRRRMEAAVKLLEGTATKKP